MHFITVLFRTLAATVAAIPVVVSPNLSHPPALALKDGMVSEGLDFKASNGEEPRIQARNKTVVGIVDLDNQVAGASAPLDTTRAYINKENTYNLPTKDFTIVPRANNKSGTKSGTQKSSTPKSGTPKSGTQKSGTQKSGTQKSSIKSGSAKPANTKPASTKSPTTKSPTTKSPGSMPGMQPGTDPKANDKKYRRDKMRPEDEKYLQNIDKQMDKNCGAGCEASLRSEQSKQSKEQREREKTNKKLPGDRKSRGETNTAEVDYQHYKNHLLQERKKLGTNGKAQLSSFHSVASEQSKQSKESKGKANP